MIVLLIDLYVGFVWCYCLVLLFVLRIVITWFGWLLIIVICFSGGLLPGYCCYLAWIVCFRWLDMLLRCLVCVCVVALFLLLIIVYLFVICVGLMFCLVWMLVCYWSVWCR